MRWEKLLTLCIFSVLLVSIASANSFGSFSSEEEKKVTSSEADFTLKVFNMGENPLELDIDSGDLEGATIIHPTSMTLEPSRVTENPSSDSSWFLTSDGRYVETKEIPIKVIAEKGRSSDLFDFEVDIRAASSSDGSGSGLVQDIAQVRSYSYQVEFLDSEQASQTSSNLESSNDSLEEGLGQQRTEGFGETVSRGVRSVTDNLADIQKSFTEDENTVEEEEEIISEREFESSSEEEEENTERKNEKSGERATGGFFQSLGLNFVTIIMIMAIAGSTFYLMRVV